jgi:hypothetical protein
LVHAKNNVQDLGSEAVKLWDKLFDDSKLPQRHAGGIITEEIAIGK